MFQEEIYTELKNRFTNIQCEKTFDDLVSPKGYCLRLDFYIESENLIIEADGNQHTDRNNPWYSDYYAHCDSIKNNYAVDNGINIIRIPYVKRVTSKYLKQYIDI